MKIGHQSVPYLIFMLLLSLLAIVSLAIKTFSTVQPHTRLFLMYADTTICFFFFVDFVLTLTRSENRARYFLTWGWLDLLSSIPLIDPLRWSRAGRVFSILRILRALRGTRFLGVFILEKRAQSAFLAAVLISLLLIFFSAGAVFEVESSSESNIRTPADALWWAVVTITTVGYGDFVPVTAEGKFIAALLMLAGVCLFGATSGLAASWFLGGRRAKSAEMVAIQELQEQIRELHQKLDLRK